MAEKITLREATEAYLKKLEEDGASPATRATYRRCLQVALDYFGPEKDLGKLLAAHTAAYFKSSAANRKPDGSPRAPLSISQIRRVFRQSLIYAHEAGKIDAVPLPRAE